MPLLQLLPEIYQAVCGFQNTMHRKSEESLFFLQNNPLNLHSSTWSWKYSSKADDLSSSFSCWGEKHTQTFNILSSSRQQKIHTLSKKGRNPVVIFPHENNNPNTHTIFLMVHNPQWGHQSKHFYLKMVMGCLFFCLSHPLTRFKEDGEHTEWTPK